MFIETDGHEFHEKTKEQAAKDKKRDRFLITKCDRLLHFTGSEIWNDIEEVWYEIVKIFDNIKRGINAQKIY